MRRALALACLLAPLLAACGGKGSSQTTQTTRQAVPKGQYGHPIKIQHAAGETFVPGRARKVITLTPGALDTSLALGVKPVGTAGPVPAYLTRRARGIPLVGSVNRPNLRRIKTLDSELILGHNRLQGRFFEQLQPIAPTVLAPIPRVGPGTPRQWKLDFRLDAESLGRIDQSEALLSRYDALAAAVRRSMGPRTRRLRVAVLEALPGGKVRLAGLDSFAGAVLVDAGMTGPEPRGVYRTLPPRRLAGLRADVVLVSAPKDGSATLRRLRRALHVRVITVRDDLWWQGDGLLASVNALGELERDLKPAG
jgi:iron complex transport system substrate-binding protein